MNNGSILQITVPEDGYTFKRGFGPFANYNVENRQRVRCIDGVTGVPLSTQWRPTPYHYPVQIAQYALEHYTKGLNG